MKKFCIHHPTRPSHWHCHKCNSTFCQSCILKREKGGIHQGEKIYLCPKCILPADWIGAANVIEPFWTRLPKFFTYPFSPRPFILIMILSVLGLFFSGPGLFKLLVRVVIWGLLLKYSYAALKATVKGDLVPPPLDARTLSDDFSQVFKQLGIFIAIGISFGFVTKTAGSIIGSVFLIGAVLLIPAMIIIFVTTESILNAINPMLFVRLAFRIGKGYLLMYLFLVFLGGAPAFLAGFAVKILPPVLALFIFNLGKNYYTIISYHLMGYVVLQYHREIGYKIDFEDFKYAPEEDKGKEEEKSRKSEIINRLNFLIKDGKHDEALNLIRDEPEGARITDLTISDYYFKLLIMKNQINELIEHGKKYLTLLVQKDKKSRACEVYLQCLKKDLSFLPDELVLFKLGGWLNDAGKAKNAIGALNCLIKSYPDAPTVPNALFRAAQIYNDGIKDTVKARKILHFVIKKYPDHDFIPHIKHYLNKLQASSNT